MHVSLQTGELVSRTGFRPPNEVAISFSIDQIPPQKDITDGKVILLELLESIYGFALEPDEFYVEYVGAEVQEFPTLQ